MTNCGPSPSKYILPPVVGYLNHDVRLERKPAYSFGIRRNTYDGNVGPGPAKYMLTDYTRYGKMSQPSYPFGMKLANLAQWTDTPAPNAYGLLKSKNSAPSYSFGQRFGNMLPMSNTATFYNLPQILGGGDFTYRKAPIYSIGQRRDVSANHSVGPGPATYLPNIDFCSKLLPTIKGRINLSNVSDTPAPNQYFLQNFKPGTRSPAYTIAARNLPMLGIPEC